MHYRFRFSIGQVMGLIAILALLMANAIFMNQGSFVFHTLLIAATLLAGLGILLYNRRLSRWVWVWIAGQSGPLLVMTLQALLSPLFANYIVAAIPLSLYLVGSIVTVVGFAMTLRDIRRKLAGYESSPFREAEESMAPTC